MTYRQNSTERNRGSRQQKSNCGTRPSILSCLLTPNSLLLTPVFLLLTPLLLLLFTGCTALKMPQLDLSKMKPPGPVTSIVATWEPAISHGEEPKRGFGGRVYFHDQDMRPVRIKGKVIVYYFIEDGRDPGDARPNEGKIFDEKTLNCRSVYQRTRLGHSYNLWVPVDIAGPERPAMRVSLIVRFIPNHGTQQISPMSTVFLPGRRGQEIETTQPVWNIQTETRHADQTQRQETIERMQTVTIR